MAFAFVQNVAQAAATIATSNAITLTGPATVNNLLVVGIRVATAAITITSVTDNVGNTYALAAGPAIVSGGAPIAYQYYGVQVTGGATIVTVNYSASASSRLIVDEFSGGEQTNATVFGVGVSNVINANSTSTTVPTLSVAGRLIVANLATNAAVTAITAGPGYTLGGTSTLTAVEYMLSSSASETAFISWTTATTNAYTAASYNVFGTTPTVTPSVYMPYLPPFMS